VSEAVYDPNGYRDDVINHVIGSISAGQTVQLGVVPDGYVGRLGAISYTLHVVVATVQASGLVQYFDPAGKMIFQYTPSGLQNSYAANVAVTVTGYVGNNTDIFQFSDNNADGVLEQCNLVDQWLQSGSSWQLGGFSLHHGETIDGIVAGINLVPAVRSVFPNENTVVGAQNALAYLLHNP
jgi:hypothetical protein